MSFHGAWWTFMPKYPSENAGALTMLPPDVDLNALGLSTLVATSISPPRNASASVVSLAKNLTEMCLTGTVPPHQCGLADSSRPVVGSKLSICQGPVPMISTPGRPIVALCSSANFFSKTGNWLVVSALQGA